MPFSLKSILSGGIGDVIEKAGKVADEFIQTKEEKDAFELKLKEVLIAHEEKQADLAQQEVDSYLKDTQSAREANTKIQESENSSWLAKNTLYILAGIVTSGFFGLLYYLLRNEIPAGNKDILNIMLGSLGTAWISIIMYFFGSSMGSKRNAEALREIAKNN